MLVPLRFKARGEAFAVLFFQDNFNLELNRTHLPVLFCRGPARGLKQVANHLKFDQLHSLTTRCAYVCKLEGKVSGSDWKGLEFLESHEWEIWESMSQLNVCSVWIYAISLEFFPVADPPALCRRWEN